MGRARTATVTLALSMIASVAFAGPEESREEREPAVACESLERGSQIARARWGQPTTTPRCFFFSGPFDLGRNDRLGDTATVRWTGARIVTAFGPHRFEGRVRGSEVSMSRRSSHEFQGDWIVTETLRGRFAQVERGGQRCRVLQAEYAYRECRGTDNCSGGCTIRARVTFSR